tara:strand:+ start:1907 stop:2584 length:678 start_codon:yes stop_codon:yes gene_type:complete
LKGPATLIKDSYFPTPIWWTDYPQWVKEIDKLMDPIICTAKNALQPVIKDRNKKYKLTGDFGFVANSPNLMGTPGLEKFENYIGNTSFNLVSEQGFDLTNYNMKITGLWAQDFPKSGGGHRTLHTHWDSHIAGFYILKGSDITSYPVFEDPRPGKLMSMLPEKNIDKITDASYQVWYQSLPGRFLFFPSYLPHQFIMDNGTKPFRFIHFTCQAFPKHIIIAKKSI